MSRPWGQKGERSLKNSLASRFRRLRATEFPDFRVAVTPRRFMPRPLGAQTTLKSPTPADDECLAARIRRYCGRFRSLAALGRPKPARPPGGAVKRSVFCGPWPGGGG
jgi:hypothetical protein